MMSGMCRNSEWSTEQQVRLSAFCYIAGAALRLLAHSFWIILDCWRASQQIPLHPLCLRAIHRCQRFSLWSNGCSSEMVPHRKPLARARNSRCVQEFPENEMKLLLLHLCSSVPQAGKFYKLYRVAIRSDPDLRLRSLDARLSEVGGGHCTIPQGDKWCETNGTRQMVRGLALFTSTVIPRSRRFPPSWRYRATLHNENEEYHPLIPRV